MVNFWHESGITTVHLSESWRIADHVSAVHVHIHFFRMRSKGSRFTPGVWGLRVSLLDVALTSATVRNRSHGRACGKFCRRGHFGGFTSGVASFRVAGVALS